MPTPPPRKRFQIHLSTAIVMMFVAGGMLGLNTRDTPSQEFKALSMPREEIRVHEFGWPRVCFKIEERYVEVEEYRVCTRPESCTTLDMGYIEVAWCEPPPFLTLATHQRTVIAPELIKDIFVALAILFVTWFLCERLIRRRAARKGA